MIGLQRVSEKIKKIKLAGIPVGNALLLLVGLGLNDALVPAASKILKAPILAGAGIAFLAKIKIVEKFLGPTLADVLSATAIATGIEDQISLRGRTHALVASLVGKISPTAGISALKGTSASNSAAAPASPATTTLGQVDISEQESRILSTLKARG